jgi:excinuclease ABC subunit C
MSTELEWRPKTGDIPVAPGVYRWLDAKGRILYVGKAKNLRARLSSYFAPLDSLHSRTRRMVETARDLQWTIVKSEFEALQLEFMWIKEFDPPFNVRLRDDKSYPYLAITLGDEVPRVFITRNRELRGVKYFGPFMNAWALRETLDTLLKVYPVRSCSPGVYQRAKSAKRACLLGDIGKCAAPCVSRTTVGEHQQLAKDLADFMNRGDTSHVDELRARMSAASDEQQYELAAHLRDSAEALETVLEKSSIVFTDQTDADVFGICDDELAAAVAMFKVRGGRIRGVRGWIVDKELQRDPSEVVEYVLQSHYAQNDADVPKEILVPALPEDAAALQLWLKQRRDGAVNLRVPNRGDKKALAETAAVNAKHSLMLYKTKRSSDFTARADALAGIQKALGLSEAPLRIECVDISHLQGTNVVGSLVVFEDGLPKKDHYRRFAIESTTDDTDSIYQLLMRRLKYLVQPELDETDESKPKKFAYRPSLLLIDGGEPQVNAAARAIRDSGVEGLAIVGIAKRLEELWLPGQPFPVILPRASDELFLLQRIRDEAHRFAISFQRQKRKAGIASELENIEGLGEKRVKALLKHFGSAKRLRVATVAEISDVAGIGVVLATQIHSQLNP